MSSPRAVDAQNPRPVPAADLRAAPLDPARRWPLDPQLAVLALLLLAEIVLFGFISTNFLTLHNLFEVLRQNVELGLLALGMTAVIMTGGIDLSVGSMLGLCAIVFGALWHNAHLPTYVAAPIAIFVGLLAGALNALLVTRINIPPLIVTLGSYSLLRGIAEGMTGGTQNFTGFPARFLSLGQGYFGPMPAQLPVLIFAAIAFYILLHRSIFGRTLEAIGLAPQGAEYAGLPVGRSVAAVYILSGLCVGCAAVIYVARLGQAKADAGTGYELAAITAVVLGGTSIFGGPGNVIGTLMGLIAIVVLENGLRLADLPAELAGVCEGVLLLLAIGVKWRPGSGAAPAGGATTTGTSVGSNEELDMRNSQLAVLCAVILAAAVIVVGGNAVLVKSLVHPGGPTAWAPPGNGQATTAPGGEAQPRKSVTIAMMPKSKGNSYFIGCQKGAEQGAGELGDQLIWDGPTDTDPGRQNEIVETWITRGVDVIAVSADNAGALSTALRHAQSSGIKVITFDADVDKDARMFFVNQGTAENIGDALMDQSAQTMGGSGDIAIITASLTASNQNQWMVYIKQRMADKYPNIHLVDFEPCDDDQSKALEVAKTILNAHPSVKLILAISSQAVPSAAEAVKQSGRTDVKVVGLGLPHENKPYIKQGITAAVILWSTNDLGYLTAYTADAVARGTLKPGDTSLDAGHLGKTPVIGDSVPLPTKPMSFTKENIDQYDF